jgi:hypothetical protein
MGKRKLKRVAALVGGQNGNIHDRRAADLLAKAQVGAVVIEDPYEAGGKIVAFRSLRNDTLAHMHHHRQIDDAQYYAGRHWQRSYELAEVGGAKAIDPTREAVDGGRSQVPGVTDEQSRAFASLARAARFLGMEGEAIIQDVLGGCCTIEMAAARRGLLTIREREYLGKRFRECLETLAVVYGYAMQGDWTPNIA